MNAICMYKSTFIISTQIILILQRKESQESLLLNNWGRGVNIFIFQGVSEGTK